MTWVNGKKKKKKKNTSKIWKIEAHGVTNFVVGTFDWTLLDSNPTSPHKIAFQKVIRYHPFTCMPLGCPILFYFGLVLWYINHCSLLMPSLFLNINSSVSNNSVNKYRFFVYIKLNVKKILFQTIQFRL